MKAMILCAGLGTRLRPLTENVPKPLVPVFGRPVVDYTLEQLADAGVREAVLNLHYKPDVIMKELGGERRGIALTYSREKEILGAVGGIRKALDPLDDGPLLVINGDVVMDVDPCEMLDHHRRHSAALTLATGVVAGRPELHVIGADASGRVRRVRDLGSGLSDDLSFFVNLGAFIYERRIIEKYVPLDKPFGFADSGGLISLLFANNEKIISFDVNSYWCDVGTPAAYLDLHFDALNGKGTKLCIERARSENRPGPFSIVKEPIYVGNNVIIDHNVIAGPYAVIGEGCKIGKGSQLRECVVLPGSIVKPGADVHRAIIYGESIIEVSKKQG